MDFGCIEFRFYSMTGELWNQLGPTVTEAGRRQHCIRRFCTSSPLSINITLLVSSLPFGADLLKESYHRDRFVGWGCGGDFAISCFI